MRKTLAIASLALLGALALPLNASAHRADKAMKFTVMLSGKAEVPVKGPKTGTGTATITIDMTKRTVCYSITVKGVDLPAAADHIHTGKAGKMGLVVVAFPTAPGMNGRAVGCAKNVNMSILKGISNHPTSYYVNVHTKKYAGGAVRGQV